MVFIPRVMVGAMVEFAGFFGAMSCGLSCVETCYYFMNAIVPGEVDMVDECLLVIHGMI